MRKLIVFVIGILAVVAYYLVPSEPWKAGASGFAEGRLTSFVDKLLRVTGSWLGLRNEKRAARVAFSLGENGKLVIVLSTEVAKVEFSVSRGRVSKLRGSAVLRTASDGEGERHKLLGMLRLDSADWPERMPSGRFELFLKGGATWRGEFSPVSK